VAEIQLLHYSRFWQHLCVFKLVTLGKKHANTDPNLKVC